jgi:hypothetical protein
MGGERKLYKNFGGESPKEDHSEDEGIDGRMGSEWILAGGVDWIQPAQDTD